jgi:uncharacterized membrane protein
MAADMSEIDTRDREPAESPFFPEHVERRNVTPAEFGTTLAHFYRGEISRANIWRVRLDATFNWAVLTTGGTLSFAFGSVESPHVVILMNTILVTVFMFIEARRYRYYEVWSSRVRIIETDYIAPLLSPKVRAVTSREVWAEHLAEDLLRPHFTVGLWEAVGRRMRRNYVWVFLLLALSWFVKIAIHPTPVGSMREFLIRSSVGSLPGWIVIAIGVIYNGLLFAITVLTIHSSSDDDEVSVSGFEKSSPGSARHFPWQRSHIPDPETTATFEPIAHRDHPRTTATLKRKDRT